MFDQTERRTIPGQDLYGTAGRISQALYNGGQISLQQVSPTSWVGKGPEVGLGMVMKATLLAYPQPGATTVDLKIEVELEDKGIILLYASWVVCLLVALPLFLYARSDANKRKRELFEAVWATTLQSGGFADAGYPGAPPPQPWG